MEIRYGYPFRGAALDALCAFLESCGLAYDENVEFSVLVTEGGLICGAGSLDGTVLKCLAVSPDFQGEGVAATVVTELVKYAVEKGRSHLFLFTKPAHEPLFSSLGFYAIAKTSFTLLMENRKDGIANFIATLKKAPRGRGGARTAGCVVAHCNPLTKGHLYLFEKAAACVDVLHVFILSENRGAFSPEVRRSLVEQSVGHLGNVIVQPTGPYLVSAATFPDYFLQKSPSPAAANGELDLTLFAERLAPPLGITHRFVGSEPYSAVTADYNRQMHEVLPRYGIEVTEFPRLELEGEAVSASRVRALLQEGRKDAVRGLVPDATWKCLI
jgi:[citrate (pro-3S)-lyase] ligase